MTGTETYDLNLSGDPADAWTEKSLRRKVFVFVSLFHVIFILSPFFWFKLWERFGEKKPLPMQVSLINLNPDGKIPGKSSDEKPSAAENFLREKFPDNSEEPETEEESGEEEFPAEAPKELEVEPPVKNESKVKVPQPEKKPAVKTQEKKLSPVAEPRKWEPKKADEITVSKNVVKGKSQRLPPKVSASDLAERLKKIQQQCKVTGGGGGNGLQGGVGLPGGIGAPGTTGTMAASYYDRISVFLYELWNQPGKSELRGMKPSVTVHVFVDASGMVKSSKIIRRSGINAMDSSVEELLSGLKSLPPPPNGAMELDISLEIVEN